MLCAGKNFNITINFMMVLKYLFFINLNFNGLLLVFYLTISILNKNN